LPPLQPVQAIRKLGGGCDWLAVRWAVLGDATLVGSYLVSYHEVATSAWPSSSVARNLTTTTGQIKIGGLRAGQDYQIRVAAQSKDSSRTSKWADAPLLRTEPATGAPDEPGVPLVAKRAACNEVRLLLPPPTLGCQSPSQASIYFQAVGSDDTDWLGSDAPITGAEISMSHLTPNRSYRFRLIAHNTAGVSRWGEACAPIHVCDAPQLASGVDTTGILPPLQSLTHFSARGTLAALVAVLAFLLVAWCRRRQGAERHLARGGRYQRASTKAIDEDEDDLEEWAHASLAAPNCQNDPTLCVDVHVPSSSMPVQIEMSTVAITSSAKLLEHLLVVVGEVTGRHDPPLAPEELHVVYQRHTGKPHLFHSGCDLKEIFSAHRVEASIRTL
jgi:hypothetical protein